MVCFTKFKNTQKCQFKKLLCLTLFIMLCVLLHVWIFRDIYKFVKNVSKIASIPKRNNATGHKPIKYVLLWNRYPKLIAGSADVKCRVSNCHFSDDRTFAEYAYYDAIIFNHNHLKADKNRPLKRVASQLYIFTTAESSSNFPACELFNDNYYNWTFTLRLDSDVVWYYFVVRNIKREIVAPSVNVVWNTKKYPIDVKIKSLFRERTKAAAWIVNTCTAGVMRDEYLLSLKEHLLQHSLQLDVYGNCFKVHCDDGDCNTMLRTKYYFYLAFETTIAEDYVSKNILYGYDNYVVPVVYGGANYSRFLPKGSYLDAGRLKPYRLAFLMSQAIKNPSKYLEYFRWTNLYTIDGDPNLYHPLCELCAALNSPRSKMAPAKQNFRHWWNGLNGMKWCLPDEYWKETSLVNIDARHIYRNINIT